MDELEKSEKDTKIRRDTQVRGSLGVPPSGKEQPTSESITSEDDSSERESELGEDERISER